MGEYFHFCLLWFINDDERYSVLVLLTLVQVGRRISVCITRIDEEKNDLIISEREAWVSLSVLMNVIERECKPPSPYLIAEGLKYLRTRDTCKKELF